MIKFFPVLYREFEWGDEKYVFVKIYSKPSDPCSFLGWQRVVRIMPGIWRTVGEVCQWGIDALERLK